MAGSTSQLVDTLLKDRYRIQREVGRGGMATVYLAQDIRDDRPVAVKVLLPDVGFALGPERFLREIELTSRFSHPNILPLYDSGELDGALYYVMPFVPGESIAAKLARDGAFGVDEAVRLAKEVAAALEYAHDKGIIHRDIKPENILLDDGHALVVDFGIARAVASVGDRKLTQTGVTIGTPFYMSPEQAMADPNLDRRSDIYSLGCVLYEMLAGQPPFVGASPQAVLARHALDQVPSLTIVRQTVSPGLEAVIVKALAKSPADRFQTAREFGEALAHPERLASSYRPTIVGAARANRRRKIVSVLAVVVAIVALAGWLGWKRWSGAHPTGVADAEAKRLAVLYFDDLSRDHSLGYMTSGLTNALIGDLSAVHGLTVISKGGAATFRGTTAPSDSIARALDVGTLVRGSVEPDGDRLRVTVRLSNAMSGADFERATFEQPTARVLQLRDTLAQEVARMIRRRLGQEVLLRSRREGAANATAWALVQRGDQQLQAGEQLMGSNDTAATLRAFHNADSLFAAGAATDARWVDPVMLRGTVAYKISRFLGDAPLRAAAYIDTGMARAGEALALAPTNPDALELRGTLRYWRWLLGVQPDAAKATDSLHAAQHDLEAAVKQDTAQAGAWAVLSHLYYQTNDVPGAKLAAARAYDADAYLSNADVILWRLFTTSYDLEQFPEATRWCDVAQRRFPTDPRFVECRLFVLGTPALPADVARAWRLADSLVALSSKPDQAYAQVEGVVMASVVVARAGLADSARRVLHRAQASVAVDPTHDIEMEKAYAWTVLHDNVNAVRALKVYLAANPSRGNDFDDDDNWRWRSLHDDPGFQAIIHRSSP